MKIAVYTIAKNECAFLHRWALSCRQADYVLLVDTGSTDDTVKEAQFLNNYITRVEQIKLNPWRFDDARNFSLMCLPEDVDVCICLDMDEVLVDGWRQIVEDAWEAGLDRLRYNYVWSWLAADSPGLTYHADKIHARHGMRWVNPVHEVLRKDARLGEEKQKFIDNTLIQHYPDYSKSRGQYIDLLALAVQERPNDDRNVHYYARELMYENRFVDALSWFKKHVDMPEATWDAEISASYRYMGDCCWALDRTEAALQWFNIAIQYSNTREAWIAAAQAYRALGNWPQCKACCEGALKITTRDSTYMNQPSSWSGWVEQMLQEANNAIASNA